MAVPAPEANPEAAPEAEADPAVLFSTSYVKPATLAYHYAPYYYGYAYPHYGYYGHYLGKRSAEPQPQPEDIYERDMPMPTGMRNRYG